MIAAIILLLLGSSTLFFGIFSQSKNRSILKNGIKTTAIITGREERKIKGLQGATEMAYAYFFYKIKYTTRSNRTIEIESNEGSKTKLEIGEKVEIIYNKNNESSFLIFENQQNNLFSAFIILGILMICISIILIVKNQHFI
ncbi:DUF3592 domain-containing protein [Soonwooa sp.]|uniref:DUF3592 domain-containing protein n=1 Tax=Soonwooa sp. TaxID=1938592 RepID=UPI003423BE9B